MKGRKIINKIIYMKYCMILFLNLFFQSCTMFSKDEKLVAEHLKSNKVKVEIYFVSMGATTNDNIQVRLSNQSQPIWVSEKYNYLKKSDLLNDSTLRLILGDSENISTLKFDTVVLNVR